MNSLRAGDSYWMIKSEMKYSKRSSAMNNYLTVKQSEVQVSYVSKSSF